MKICKKKKMNLAKWEHFSQLVCAFSVLLQPNYQLWTAILSVAMLLAAGVSAGGTTIAPNETLTGTIASAGQMDTYTFSGYAGEAVVVSASGTSSGMRACASVYDPNGTFIDYIYNYGSEGYNRATLSLPLTSSGTYTIRVHAYLYSSSYIGSYSVSLSVVTGRGGTPIAPNETLTGTIASAGQMDTYTFSGYAGEAVVVSASGTSSGMRACASVYDPNGTFIDYIYNYGSEGYNGSTLSLPLTSSGTYTIRVHAYIYSSFYIGSYSVSLSLSGGESQVATPDISPNGGTFSTATLVTLSCSTSGATIRYTTNGSIPTSGSTQYTAPFTVSSSCTVKARAFKSDYTDSDVASASFTINNPLPKVATPSISPNGGTFSGSALVTLSCSTSGATIRYTTNGSDPTSRSTLYSSPFTVSSSSTVMAKAFKTGYTDSDVASASFTINDPLPKVAAPSISPNGGTFTAATLVTLSCSTHGATIRYTTDGSNPTSGSTQYTVPFTVSSSCTVKARAFKSGYADSDITPPASFAFWDNGSGDIIYSFDGLLYIWDISGSYSNSLYSSIVFNLDYTLTQDTAGKITGFGYTQASVDTDYGTADIDVAFAVTGSVSQKNGTSSVKLSFKGKGTISLQGQSVKANWSSTVKAVIDPAASEMTGEAKVRLSASGASASETVSFTQKLPDDMDGSATLSISCAPSGRMLLGTGELTLSNDETHNFGVKGTYNVRKDESSLTLKGDARGNSLKMKIDGSDGRIKSLNGKVLGQVLKATDIMPMP